MKKFSKGILGLGLIIGMIFLFSACAKKGVEQVEEITPPAEKEVVIQPSPPEEIEAPAIEEEVVEVPQVKAPTLEEEILAFEARDIHFDFDRFNLKPEAKMILAENARFLKLHPELKVRIEGHCDERGTIEYNLALGQRRAKSAQDYLIFLGINPTRISTISYGEEKPLDTRHCEEAWSLNRRAHFDIIGK